MSKSLMAEPAVADLSAFNSYVKLTEARLAWQHQYANSFLAPADHNFPSDASLRPEPVIERVATPTDEMFAVAMLHHWRGTAFVAGATIADFERLMKDFDAYPRYFNPEVLQARVLTSRGDGVHAFMRVRQRHVITVVMDSTYDVTFGRLDEQHGYSISRSTQISEIDSPGSNNERVLSAKEEHGFLWRLNTYWSYEERDNGLYLQVESISLTRSIPRGLDWAVRPFVESVPRESIEFALRSTCNALRK